MSILERFIYDARKPKIWLSAQNTEMLFIFHLVCELSDGEERRFVLLNVGLNTRYFRYTEIKIEASFYLKQEHIAANVAGLLSFTKTKTKTISDLILTSCLLVQLDVLK